MNVWTFTGNLGADSELRHTSDGTAVVNFRVGVKTGYGDKAGTVWANCSFWGKRGEAVAPYLNKGQAVAISGEASTREYESKGGKGFSLDVRVNELTLIGGKKDQAAPAAQGFRDPPPADDFDEQKIPF